MWAFRNPAISVEGESTVRNYRIYDAYVPHDDRPTHQTQHLDASCRPMDDTRWRLRPRVLPFAAFVAHTRALELVECHLSFGLPNGEVETVTWVGASPGGSI